MKHLLLTTIAAVVLVGCGCKPTWLSIFNAADQGNIEAVKKHLADGVDVNKKDKGGYTPLHWAAFRGHKEVAELLIAKGADVNTRNDRGWTPLDFALNVKNGGAIADFLRKHGAKTERELNDVLIEAGKKGDIEAVKQHLAAGTDVNEKANDGVTPLHFATTKEIAELLIDNGADVNVKHGLSGETPLHYAAYKGHKEIVELLIAKGADLNARDVDGFTPVDLAKGHPGIADMLRKHGGKTRKELRAAGN